jgi:mono/diheme cytochrome c family protein
MTKTGVLLTTALFLAAGAPALRAAGPGDDAQVKKGQEVYTAQKCSVCHQIAAKGNASNKLDGIGGKLTAEEIKGWIVDPVTAAKNAKPPSTKKPLMPTKYAKLPAADIDALVAYLGSLK